MFRSAEGVGGERTPIGTGLSRPDDNPGCLPREICLPESRPVSNATVFAQV